MNKSVSIWMSKNKGFKLVNMLCGGADLNTVWQKNAKFDLNTRILNVCIMTVDMSIRCCLV